MIENKTNKNNNTNITSLISILIIFYMVLASNFMDSLFSKSLVQFFNSKNGQHLIGLSTLFILISEYNSSLDIFTIILYALLGYIWFVFTTKMDVKFNLLIIALMFVGYIYEYNMKNKEIVSVKDQALTEKELNKIKDKNNRFRYSILVCILAVTIIGNLAYYTKKKVQYGGNFRIDKFILE